MAILKGLLELIKGMGITGKHLGRHAVTIQYPEQKWTMPERSRGVVVLLSDKETGDLNCTACELCEKACPTRAIKIESFRDENKKKVLQSFTVDNTICCFCGLCEDACNFCAIKMAPMYYEMSVYDKSDLVWNKDKLQEMGRKVDYVDTRKKKVAKPAAPKPEAKTEAKPEAKAEAPSTVEKPAEKPTEANAEDKPAAETNTDNGEAKDNG